VAELRSTRTQVDSGLAKAILVALRRDPADPTPAWRAARWAAQPLVTVEQAQAAEPARALGARAGEPLEVSVVMQLPPADGPTQPQGFEPAVRRAQPPAKARWQSRPA